jgi:PAS domain S-box-containing protein
MFAQSDDLGISENAAGVLLEVAEIRRKAILLKAGGRGSAILDSTDCSTIATNEKGIIQSFDLGAERMFGYKASDLVDKLTPADICDPLELVARTRDLSVEMATPIKSGFEALVFKASRGIEDIHELTFVRKDGGRFPALVAVTALRDAQEAITGYLLVGTDNTARKQAETGFLQAGALQRAIFNSTTFSSIATDTHGVVQIFNVGAERMLGYTAEEVVNKLTVTDLHDHAEIAARAGVLSLEFGAPVSPGFEALAFKAARGMEDIYELTTIRNDGSRLSVVLSVTALRDSCNTIIGYLLIGTDNTARQEVEKDRKKLEQRLRDQQFYTRSLIESSIDAMLAIDPNGIITDANKQAEMLTGYTREELLGAPFKNFFTDPGRAQAGIDHVLTEGSVTNYELTAQGKNAVQTVVSCNARTFNDRDGNLSGVFAAARDMTELKTYEEATRQKNRIQRERDMAYAAKLAAMNEELDSFSYSISHDLRAPLRHIHGYAELLQAATVGQLSDKANHYLTTIIDADVEMGELIDDLLAFSQVGRAEIETTSFELGDLVKEVIRGLEMVTQGRSIDWRIVALPRVVANVSLLKQVLTNLIDNAIKYSRNRASATIEIGCEGEEAGRAILFVRDDGAGFDMQYVDKLFGVFQRLHRPELFEGTGIGLATVRRIINRHGGRVWATGAENEGATFYFTLELARPLEGPAE